MGKKVIETFKFFCKALPEVQTGLIIINDGSSTDLTDAIAAIKKAVPFLLLMHMRPIKGKDLLCVQVLQNPLQKFVFIPI